MNAASSLRCGSDNRLSPPRWIEGFEQGEEECRSRLGKHMRPSRFVHRTENKIQIFLPLCYVRFISSIVFAPIEIKNILSRTFLDGYIQCALGQLALFHQWPSAQSLYGRCRVLSSSTTLSSLKRSSSEGFATRRCDGGGNRTRFSTVKLRKDDVK